MVEESSTSLGIRDGGLVTERFQSRNEFLQSAIQYFLAPVREVDKFQPLRLDSQLLQPELRVTHPPSGTHGSLEVLASFLRASQHKNSFGVRGQCFQEVMRFHLAGAWDSDKAEAGSGPGKIFLLSVSKEPEIVAVIHDYFDRLCFHFLLSGTSTCAGHNHPLCHFRRSNFKPFLSRLVRKSAQPSRAISCRNALVNQTHAGSRRTASLKVTQCYFRQQMKFVVGQALGCTPFL